VLATPAKLPSPTLPHTPALRGRRSPARRGMSMLEVVFAVATLALITAAGFASIDFVMRLNLREQQRLGAAEVANRLLISYLDDEKSLPSEFNTISYGEFSYRYRKSRTKFSVIEASPVDAPSSGARPLSLDRFQQITVRVWLSEETGGSFDGSGAPSVTLTRLLDPVALRNPDSLDARRGSPEGMRGMMDELKDAANIPGSPGSNRPAPGTPGATPGSPGSRPPPPSTPGPSGRRDRPSERAPRGHTPA
jgi:type II secretory pathway pseudopilin PulG